MQNELMFTEHVESSVTAYDLPSLLRKGMKDDAIEKTLRNQYQDDYLVNNLMKEVKRLRNQQRTTNGLILAIIGAGLLLLSCVLSLTGSISSGSFSIYLFGFTTIGIAIVFAGLVKIFG